MAMTERSVLRTAGGAPAAIVIVIFIASSAVPFVQLGSGWPGAGWREIADIALLLLAWMPFVAIVVAFARATESERNRGAATAVVGHLALFLVAPPAHAWLFLWMKSLFTEGGVTAGTAFQIITFVGALQYLVIVAVLLAISAGRETQRARLHAAELEAARETLHRQLADARLDALTARLQPHFLFNTLNSVSILASDDPVAARQMISRLSDLLRAVLMEPAGAHVTVEREVELVRAYMEIQCVRFGDKLRFGVEVDPRSEQALVPLFILQPLAENAVAHAIGHRSEPGRVVVRAGIRDGTLSLSVSDDGPTDVAEPTDGHGIGLRATRERLAAAFGDAHRFELAGNEWGGSTALIEIPLVHA